MYSHMHAAAKSLQSCPTLCDPIDGSPPGSPVSGILQARTLEWVAISFAFTHAQVYTYIQKDISCTGVLLLIMRQKECYRQYSVLVKMSVLTLSTQVACPCTHTYTLTWISPRFQFITEGADWIITQFNCSSYQQGK